MKLIVGLGNPGKVYEQTRHNIGSTVVKEFARRQKVILKRSLFGSSLSVRCKIKGQECLLATPLSYMNLSGGAVKSLIKKYKIDLDNLIIIADDLDLELGRLKIKFGGSFGGHKGLENIIAVLGSKSFCRLRIGIGRPENKFVEITDYVLSVFRKNEKTIVDEMIEKACSAIEFWAEAGTFKTMNIINRDPINDKDSGV